jgi:uncharacterized protein YrzB (UPF0473 family)
MEEKEFDILEDDFGDDTVIVLNDMETGEEIEFALLARTTVDDKLYYALAPMDEEEEAYVILRAREDGEDIVYESIDDDEEFDRVSDVFDDLFSSADVDFDESK